MILNTIDKGKGLIMRLLKIARLAVLSPVAFLSFGCSDLGLDPQQDLSDAAYFASIADFRAAIIGPYNELQGASYYGRSVHLMSDIMGEDVKQNGSANRYQEFADFEGQRQSGHNFEQELWAEGYEGINMVNKILDAEFEPTAALQSEFDQIIGEAHALRALTYFDMVKMYAQHYTFTAGATHLGVPIVLVSDVILLPTRNTVAEVYSQIISDLNTAMGLMTQTRAGPFMFTDAAAQALLSRIYLYMEDFSMAIAMADAVIGSGRYSLVTGQSYVDQFVDGGSSEAILEISFDNNDNPGGNSLGRMYTENGYGDYLPARDLLDLIDPADIRWGMFTVDPVLTGIYAAHRVTKWRTANGSDHIPIIRLSEIYLNRAEARARSGQDVAAQADLNMIRQRGLASAPDVTSTGPALLAEILIERRIELGFEGHRIHDIMRHKQDVSRVDYTGDVGFQGYPCNFCILPIPFGETDANPNITQNDGY